MDSPAGTPQADVRGAGRVARVIAASLAIAALALASWLGVRAFVAYDALINAQSRIGDITANLASLNFLALPVAIDEIDGSLGTARAMMSDPIWGALESAPVIGGSAASVRELTAALDDFVGEGLAPLAEDARDLSLDSFRPREGQIDVDAFETLVASADSATEALRVLRERIESIDQSDALGPVRSVIARVLAQIVAADESATRAGEALRLLEPAIGLEGPRTYAVVLLDSSVDTAIGGEAVGALELTFADGTIEVGAGETAFEVGLASARFRGLEREPDFAAYAGEAAATLGVLWGSDVDAVLAIDYVGLASVLDVTGPITIADGSVVSGASLRDSVGGSNSVDAQTATSVLETSVVAVVAGEGASRGFLASAATLRDERRLKLWSANPAEQTVVESTSLSGQVTAGDGTSTRFGVFIVDRTSGELGSELSAVVEAVLSCDSEAQLVIALEAGASTIERDLIFVAPRGATISGVDGADSVVAGAPAIDGVNSSTARLRIESGDRATVTVRFRWDAELEGATEVVTNARLVPTDVATSTCR